MLLAMSSIGLAALLLAMRLSLAARTADQG